MWPLISLSLHPPFILWHYVCREASKVSLVAPSLLRLNSIGGWFGTKVVPPKKTKKQIVNLFHIDGKQNVIQEGLNSYLWNFQN